MQQPFFGGMMRTNYILRNDIVNNHNDRLNYLKKYLPFFKLQETSLAQYKEGKYAVVDVGYITMALLRYFIEENHFNDRSLSYQEVSQFIGELLRVDFELNCSKEEETEISEYLFDKMKNDGKPFTMDYFDPATKKVKTARMKLFESKLDKDLVLYSITADAIEFYLETKEVKDESKISIQQLLLEKMIATKNFKGGTDVIKRINSEVVKLRLKKQEVLVLLAMNVFEGVKALEDFQRTGMQWFEEEQKAFVRNKELIEQALRKAEDLAREHGNQVEYTKTLEDIYELETQLQKAMSNHSTLLSDCMELQVKSDEIISKHKFSRLRNAFDFNRFVEVAKQHNNVSILSHLVTPLCTPMLKKSFFLGNVDELLTYTSNKEEAKEKVREAKEEVYRFDDEIEEERISGNYFAMLKVLLQMIVTRQSFTLMDFNKELEITFFDDIFKNSDYYSFLVHLCQKREYDLERIITHQDTFFDAILVQFLKESSTSRYEKLKFQLVLPSSVSEEGMAVQMQSLDGSIEHAVTTAHAECRFVTSNIVFMRMNK